MNLATLSSGSKGCYIYHERQESQLCGQHALNSLLQIPDSFTPQSLSEIALQLDAKESGIGARGGGESQNVSEDGNFSIQVLTIALEAFGVDLLNWKSESFKDKEPLNEGVAFVVNRQSHWFTIRKINKKWWNLNSGLERPELVGEFYLSESLNQLHADGYSIFIAKGNVQPGGTKGDESYASEKGMATWWEEEVLMRPPEEGGSGDPEKAQVDPFAGSGNMMVESNTIDDATLAALVADSEAAGEVLDADMVKALAMSMQESKPQAKAPVTKEEERALRLAAMAARGLC